MVKSWVEPPCTITRRELSLFFSNRRDHSSAEPNCSVRGGVIGRSVSVHKPISLTLVRQLSPMPSALKRRGYLTRFVAVNTILVQGSCGNAGYPAAPGPSGPSMSASGTASRTSGASSGQVAISAESSGASGDTSGDVSSGNPLDDASPDAPSGTTPSSGLLDDADSGIGESTSESGPESSTSSSELDANGLVGPPGCLNPLGSVWSVTESDDNCASTWTRQGTTATFADQRLSPCNVTATLTVTISGVSVSAFWTSSSDNDDCNYIGTLNASCTSVSGDYTCTSGDAASGTWTATLR
jgi:hypothetical protein